MNTSPEPFNRLIDGCSAWKTLPGLRGFPRNSGRFMVVGPPAAKNNAMKEWEEKKKTLDISDEHAVHMTPLTATAATATVTQHGRPVTTIVEFIADGNSPLSDCQQEAGQAYYYLTYNDVGRKRVVEQRMKHIHEIKGNVLFVVSLPDT